MSGYVYKGRPHPTGLHKKFFDEVRKRKGLDEDGYPIKRDPEEDEPEDTDTR